MLLERQGCTENGIEHLGNKMMSNNLNNSQTDIFSLATLFYSRLRRVTSRVIDVMYFIDNKEYARFILNLANKADDAELQRYAERLDQLLELTPPVEEVVEEQSPVPMDTVADEITEEEIYRAQVSHHYIGALR